MVFAWSGFTVGAGRNQGPSLRSGWQLVRDDRWYVHPCSRPSLFPFPCYFRDLTSQFGPRL